VKLVTYLKLTLALAEPPVIVELTGLTYELPLVANDCVQLIPPAGVADLAPAVKVVNELIDPDITDRLDAVLMY
jgi:hypothetical protein